jgi:serine/threonine protein phosphatase PrpC
LTHLPHDTVVEPAVPVELSFRTDPGRDPEKQVNEDSGFHLVTRFGTLCVVCDGMGGHANGQDASRAAVEAIRETFERAPEGANGRELLREGITLGHRRIRELPLASGEARSGSTVVAVLVTPHGAEIAHVGDSRIYWISRGKIAQITRDHSMVQLMVEAGMIKPEEAATHPDANKIMRALGIAADVQVDLREEPVTFSSGDVFVLASDGLTDLVSEAEILQIAGSQPGAQAVGQLVDLANARGGHDNITVLLARTGEASHVPEGRAIPKTVASTAHEPPADPLARSSGGTVVAAPLPHVAQAHVGQVNLAVAKGTPGSTEPFAPALGVAPMVAPSGAEMPTPSLPRRSPPPRPTKDGSSTGLRIALVLLAVVVLAGVAVALYLVLEKPKRVAPTIVTPLSDLPHTGQSSSVPEPNATTTEAPAQAEATPPLAPTASPTSTSRHHGKHAPAPGTATEPPVPVPVPVPVPTTTPTLPP